MAAREGHGTMKGSFLEKGRHGPNGRKDSNEDRDFTEREIGFLISNTILLYHTYQYLFFFFDRQKTNLDGTAAMMR